MRIAFVHPFLYRYPRGIERFTISLANALVQGGEQVDIRTWRWPRPVRIDSVDSTGGTFAMLKKMRFLPRFSPGLQFERGPGESIVCQDRPKSQRLLDDRRVAHFS